MIFCLKSCLRRLLAYVSQQQPIREGVVCGKREREGGEGDKLAKDILIVGSIVPGKATVQPDL